MGAAIGLRRGVVAGLIFGSSILIGPPDHGADAKADLPNPEILLIAITTGLGAAFGALGGWLRERVTRRQGPSPRQLRRNSLAELGGFGQ